MKCYIVGPVASGKSTLARRLSEITGVPATHLDEVYRVHDPAAPMGNRKRPEAEWKAIFYGVLDQDNFIIEDTGREKFAEGLAAAEEIVLLCPSAWVRRMRILTRWLRQKMGLEACIYSPNLAMLRGMFRWTKGFDTGEDGTKGRVAQFPEKTTVLRTNREVETWLQKFT